MPYLALFTCRDIVKGEELSFDYLMSGATEDVDDPLDVSSLDNGTGLTNCWRVFTNFNTHVNLFVLLSMTDGIHNRLFFSLKASISESRYDADRSGEDSEIFISAMESFGDDAVFTPKNKSSNGDDASPELKGRDKENVTPTPANVDLQTTSSVEGSSKPTTSSKSASGSASSISPARQKLLNQFNASTPRRSPPKKALDKKTPCK